MSTAIDHVATQFNMGGANVVPLTENGEGLTPPESWESWLEKPQTADDLREMPWTNSKGLAVLNGVEDWSTLAITGPDASTTTGQLLRALDLPEDYAWVVKSPGEVQVLVKAEDVPSQAPSSVDIDISEVSRLTVRLSDSWTAMPPTLADSGTQYRYCHRSPEQPPTKRPFTQIKAALESFEASSSQASAEDGSDSEKASTHDALPLPTVAKDITPLSVKWLWDGFFAQGMIHILDGLPGVGKTTALLDIAAHLSRGETPEAGKIAPKNTLYISGEDLKEVVHGPRYQVAGGDMSRLQVLDGDDTGKLRFPHSTSHVGKIIRRRQISLCVIDPLSSMVSRKYSMNDGQAMREVLGNLQRMASETGCALILVRHPNKKEGRAAIHRGTGSAEIIAQARLAFMMGRHPENHETRVMAWNKNNLSPRSRYRALTFSLESTDWEVDDESGSQPVVHWGQTESLIADDLMCKSKGRGRPPIKKNKAKNFLREQLSDGPVPRSDLDEAVEGEDFSTRTMENASEELEVQKEQKGGQWIWSLPSDHFVFEAE